MKKLLIRYVYDSFLNVSCEGVGDEYVTFYMLFACVCLAPCVSCSVCHVVLQNIFEEKNKIKKAKKKRKRKRSKRGM